MRSINILFKFVVIFFVFSSCNRNEKYIHDLDSGNPPGTIIKAAFELGEARDTAAILALLKNILDPRMSTNIRFKGMTVCYSKLGALGKIAGIKPLKKIDQFGVDTAAVKFYLKRAWERGTIQSVDEIDIYYH